MCSASSFQASVSTVSSRARSAQLMSRPSRSSEPGAGRFPIGVETAVGFAGQPLDDPLQHPDVLAEAGPDELAAGVLAEPVHVVQLRQLARVGGDLADLQPVAEVVAHVVAAERQHRERVVPQLADRALGRGGLLRGDVRAQEHPVIPAERLDHQRHRRRPPAAEQDRRDRHPGRVVPLRRDDRALGRRRGEPGVRVRRGLRRTRASSPGPSSRSGARAAPRSGPPTTRPRHRSAPRW